MLGCHPAAWTSEVPKTMDVTSPKLMVIMWVIVWGTLPQNDGQRGNLLGYFMPK